ncbi:hypothetical protein ANN_27447 [Periplaneta americana]|uniref:C2H2-type domain-containing protein n=1 Tax=Periplaneta americana TaxID=6978 RepID=A0ABQ8RVV5_PERAM|nr:hypothetical protein ANN_27447 [Periplaneta americana]
MYGRMKTHVQLFHLITRCGSPLNMWAGIIGDRLRVGPHALVNRLTGQAYTNFLENTIPHVLEDIPLINRQHIHFLHDGAPAHFSRTAPEGNLSHLQLPGIKTECVDHSYDLTSEVKVEDPPEPASFLMMKCEVEETPQPVTYPMVKSEVDEDSFDLNRLHQEEKVEISVKEDKVLLESNASNVKKSRSSECHVISRNEDELTQCCSYNLDRSIACNLSHESNKCNRCDACGKCCSGTRNLKIHSRIHTGERRFKCDMCGKSFSQLTSLKHHSRIHTGERPFKCDICGKSFSQLTSLKYHSRIHTGERPFKCGICGKCFSLSASLKYHSRIHTGERPFKCDVCGKCFAGGGVLKIHSRKHTGERPFKCNMCEKSFKQSASLKYHSHFHSGETPFKCDACGKCFLGSGNLKIHSRTHTGERPFKCDICGKSFKQSGGLKYHSLIHTGERPFKCDACGKCFSGTRNLKVHSRTHTGERPFKCDMCGKSYKQPGSLKYHSRMHKGRCHSNAISVEIKVAGYTAKNKKDILYPNNTSAIRPVPQGPDIPVPLPPESDTLPSPSSSTETESPVDHTYEPENTADDRCFNQSELNDLVRDLNLAKESAELLSSRLKEKKVLAEANLKDGESILPFHPNLIYHTELLIETELSTQYAEHKQLLTFLIAQFWEQNTDQPSKSTAEIEADDVDDYYYFNQDCVKKENLTTPSQLLTPFICDIHEVYPGYVVMNGIKMEAEVDPLSLESQDNKYKIKENMALLEVGKLPYLQVVDIKTECVDHSYDFTSEIKVEDSHMVKCEVEDTAEPVIYPVVKYEIDENLFDMDRVQQEEKVEISSNDDDILLERNTNNDKNESSECDWIARDEQNLMQNGCYIFDDSIACDVSHDCIKCNICNEDFVTPQLLNRHFQIHTLEKSFKCDVCGDSFFEVNDLEKHSVLHTGGTPVQCDVRGKIFVQPVYVKSEEPLETDDEEFKCDVCGKCFSESGELKKHCLTHKVHKPFHCKLCGKWFSSSGTLKRHQSRIHIVERTVECDQESEERQIRRFKLVTTIFVIAHIAFIPTHD